MGHGPGHSTPEYKKMTLTRWLEDRFRPARYSVATALRDIAMKPTCTEEVLVDGRISHDGWRRYSLVRISQHGPVDLWCGWIRANDVGDFAAALCQARSGLRSGQSDMLANGRWSILWTSDKPHAVEAWDRNGLVMSADRSSGLVVYGCREQRLPAAAIKSFHVARSTFSGTTIAASLVNGRQRTLVRRFRPFMGADSDPWGVTYAWAELLAGRLSLALEISPAC